MSKAFQIFLMVVVLCMSACAENQKREDTCYYDCVAKHSGCFKSCMIRNLCDGCLASRKQCFNRCGSKRNRIVFGDDSLDFEKDLITY